jgi:hypothetical protein
MSRVVVALAESVNFAKAFHSNRLPCVILLRNIHCDFAVLVTGNKVRKTAKEKRLEDSSLDILTLVCYLMSLITILSTTISA